MGSLLFSQTLIENAGEVSLETSYYLHNHRGDVVAVIDEDGGSVNTYRYSAFGEIIDQTTQRENDILFSSKRYDASTDLSYFGARYYDASLGRFISRDPLGYIDGPNGYIYVSNNPINLIDPDGLCKEKSSNEWDLSSISIGLGLSTALVADDSTLIGVADDILIPAVIAGTAALAVYQNKDALMLKMEREIERIKARQQGPQGVQYSLRAKVAGEYPNVRGGTVHLEEGDVWKYGETTQKPSVRYTKEVLDMFSFVPESSGSQIKIKIQEKIKIYGYFLEHWHLPPGNRIFR